MGRVVVRAGLMLVICAAQDVSSQVPDSTQPPKYRNRLTVLPFAAYAPETGVQFGVGGGWQFKPGRSARDPETRASYLAGAFTLTTKGQWTAGTETSVFMPGGKWWLAGRAALASFPLIYYGIGSQAERADSNRMKHRFIKLEGKALRRLSGPLYGGVYYRLHSFFDVDWQFDSRIPPDLSGGTGGVSSGLGVSFQYDTRPSQTTPTRGRYLLLDYLRNAKLIGSDFGYDYLVIDARSYLPVRGGKDVVALNLYAEFNGPAVPVQTMSMLSNSTTQELMRGVYLGRFRDRHEVVAQADYRGHLKGRFGYVVYGSAGNVFGSAGNELFDDLKFTYGGGLRFNVNPQDPLNLRVDFTFTSFGESGLSIGAAEAF